MTGAKTTRVGSLQIVVFVLIGFWLVGQEAGSFRGMFVFGVSGLLFGVAIVLRAQQTDLTRTLASLLVPIIGVSLLTGIGLSGLNIVSEVSQSQTDIEAITQMIIKDVGISLAAGIAIFGTVGTIAGGVGDQGVSRLVPTAIGNLLTVGTFLLTFIYFRSALLTSAAVPTIEVSRITSQLLQPPNPGSAMVSFWFLVFITIAFAFMALSAVPLVELASRSQEDRFKQWSSGVQSWLVFVAVLLVLLAIVAFVLFAPRPEPVQGFREQLRPAVSEPLFAVIQMESIRLVLLATSLAFAAVTVAFKTLEYLTGSITNAVRRLVPAVTGGLVAIAIPIPVTAHISALVSRIPQAQRQPVEEMIAAIGPYGVLVGGMGAAIGGVLLLLILISIAGGIRFIPLRGSGSALAASGLAIGAIVLALTDSEPFTVLGMITMSILIWNVGERGVTTRKELGGSPPLTLETLHSLGGVIIIIPAAAFAWWIHTTSLTSISAPEGTVIGVVASLLALFLLLGHIKG